MERYKMLFDYHTHTTFSHGKGSIEDNVKEAINKGLEAIAITDHGPGHKTYGIKMSDVPKMRSEIKRLQKAYPQIKIYLGIEANIIDSQRAEKNAVAKSDNNLDITQKQEEEFDFVLAGYHFGLADCYCIPNFMFSHGIGKTQKKEAFLRERNTRMVLKALEQNHIRVLTHPGDKAPVDIAEIAKMCAKTNTLMELNMKHPHLTVENIKIAAKEDVKFIISSDAHIPENVGTFDDALKRGLRAGLDPDRIVNIKRI